MFRPEHTRTYVRVMGSDERIRLRVPSWLVSRRRVRVEHRADVPTRDHRGHRLSADHRGLSRGDHRDGPGSRNAFHAAPDPQLRADRVLLEALAGSPPAAWSGP